MFEFFKIMKSVADTNDESFKDSAELVKEIAQRAGYTRYVIYSKDGVPINKTHYKADDNDSHYKWDEALIAKWFCWYKPLFIKRLLCHKRIEEYFEQCIYGTFLSIFKSLDIDSIRGGGSVKLLVNTALSHKIFRSLSDFSLSDNVSSSSIRCTEEPKKYSRINFNKTFNNSMQSLEGLYPSEGSTTSMSSLQYSEDATTVLDLKKLLKGNEYGERMLNVMLASNSKVHTVNLAKYFKFSQCEIDNRNVVIRKIKDAYNIILKYVKENLDCGKDFSRAELGKFRIGKGCKYLENDFTI